MKLYYSPNSPYARKCRIVVAEHGLTPQVTNVEVDTAKLPKELLDANPLGKIPALVVDKNFTLYESPVICEYLDAFSGKPSFFPKERLGRFTALNLAAIADGIMDLSVEIVMQGRRPEKQRWPDLVEKREAAILRTIGVLEKLCARDAHFTIGHINTGVALQYVDFRLPHLEWRSDHPALVRWLEPVLQRPSFTATAPRAA